jgi:hypothetical protein
MEYLAQSSLKSNIYEIEDILNAPAIVLSPDESKIYQTMQIYDNDEVKVLFAVLDAESIAVTNQKLLSLAGKVLQTLNLFFAEDHVFVVNEIFVAVDSKLTFSIIKLL